MESGNNGKCVAAENSTPRNITNTQKSERYYRFQLQASGQKDSLGITEIQATNTSCESYAHNNNKLLFTVGLYVHS